MLSLPLLRNAVLEVVVVGTMLAPRDAVEHGRRLRMKALLILYSCSIQALLGVC